MLQRFPYHPNPFGSVMQGRNWTDVNRNYRYGFNGKEKDFETANDNYDFGARIYDGRLGRWLSLDPWSTKYVGLSPFCFVANMPIVAIDPDGKKIVNPYTSQLESMKRVVESERNAIQNLQNAFGGATTKEAFIQYANAHPEMALNAEVGWTDYTNIKESLENNLQLQTQIEINMKQVDIMINYMRVYNPTKFNQMENLTTANGVGVNVYYYVNNGNLKNLWGESESGSDFFYKDGILDYNFLPDDRFGGDPSKFMAIIDINLDKYIKVGLQLDEYGYIDITNYRDPNFQNLMSTIKHETTHVYNTIKNKGQIIKDVEALLKNCRCDIESSKFESNYNGGHFPESKDAQEAKAAETGSDEVDHP